MTRTLGADFGMLRAAMTGEVITPEAPNYEDARRVFNAEIDRRPAVIARCESATDVATAIAFARGNGLEIGVRGGAHNLAGASSVDDGMMIDLRRMNAVTVDPALKRARVGGGALLAEVDAATQQHGLAVPMGEIGHTGVAGLTLGGGMGWLTRLGGLSIDNLISAEVVCADSRVLRVDAEHEPDLFWAVRGGGGNFGVVTELEFRLHEVGPIVQLGFLFWGLDQGAEVLRLGRDLAKRLSREFNVLIGGVNAPPAPFVPADQQLKPGYVLMIVGFGEPEAHAQVVGEIRAALPPLVEHVAPIPFVALQQLQDEAMCWGRYYYEKSCYLPELTDGAIEALTRQVPRRNSPWSVALLYLLDEAYSEVSELDTAFGGTRTPQFAAFLVGVCTDAETLAAERAWARDTWHALLPHSRGIAAYVNAIEEVDAERVRASYGEKYERLARIKSLYDPDNVFHRNINITPV